MPNSEAVEVPRRGRRKFQERARVKGKEVRTKQLSGSDWNRCGLRGLVKAVQG